MQGIKLILLLLECGPEFFNVLLLEGLLFHFLNLGLELNNSPLKLITLSLELRDLELLCLHFRLQDL